MEEPPTGSQPGASWVLQGGDHREEPRGGAKGRRQGEEPRGGTKRGSQEEDSEGDVRRMSEEEPKGEAMRKVRWWSQEEDFVRGGPSLPR